MAKRKRLTPAQADFLGTAPTRLTGPGGAGPGPAIAPAPIAQVTGDAAARAALADLTAEMEAAREQGLMLERLPLSAIDIQHLVRDRMVQDEEEMEALISSLEARGQQTPVEVVRLPDPRDGKTHGLISGWRRLTALHRLYERTQDPRFATVRALVVAPDSAQAAYVAMVEENEIRVNLSHYERARIALRAVEEGVYATAREALLSLYRAAPRSKRSKIGSFVTLVEALDPVLTYPTAISEKLGLSLARALSEDPELGAALAERLRAAQVASAEEELRILSAAVAPPAPASPPEPAPVAAPKKGSKRASEPDISDRYAGPIPTAPLSVTAAPGVQLRFDRRMGWIELSGEGVDQTLFEALQGWLSQREG